MLHNVIIKEIWSCIKLSNEKLKTALDGHKFIKFVSESVTQKEKNVEILFVQRVYLIFLRSCWFVQWVY